MIEQVPIPAEIERLINGLVKAARGWEFSTDYSSRLQYEKARDGLRAAIAKLVADRDGLQQALNVYVDNPSLKSFDYGKALTKGPMGEVHFTAHNEVAQPSRNPWYDNAANTLFGSPALGINEAKVAPAELLPDGLIPDEV